MITYGEEPLPYEYSEQDLYANIQRDIDGYYAGKLGITVKSPYKRLKEECHHWREAYMTETQVNEELRAYIMNLENLLLKQGIITDRMKVRFEEEKSLFL